MKATQNNKLSFQLFIKDDFIFYTGEGVNTLHHSYPAASIIIAQHGAFEIYHNNKVQSSNFCILPVNYHHVFRCDKNIPIIMLFIDPKSHFLSPLKKKFKLGREMVHLAGIEEKNISQWLFSNEIFNTNHIYTFLNDFVLMDNEQSRPIDDRILKTIELIENHQENPLIITDISKKIFLSESRLRSIFKKEMGVSISTYTRWVRLKKAGMAITKGMKFTSACYQAGFYDVAHFNRVFREMFGINPSSVIK